jgi:hypothetical protein
MGPSGPFASSTADLFVKIAVMRCCCPLSAEVTDFLKKTAASSLPAILPVASTVVAVTVRIPAASTATVFVPIVIVS